MRKKEQRVGFAWLGLMLISILLTPVRSSAFREFLFWGGNFTAAVLIFRQFLQSSFQVPLTPFATVAKFALLGYGLAFLANLLTNDLIFYFLPRHFYYDETGPHFENVCKVAMEVFARENFPLTALSMILFVPLVEEIIHRGLIFGSLVQKNLPLAYLLSTVLYCLVLTIPLWRQYSVDYLIISFLQYIPINLMLCWIYTRTETLLTPILAHMVMNGVSIFTLR